MPPKNSGGSTKFLGGHKVIHRTAQTAFVRVVTPRNNCTFQQKQNLCHGLRGPHVKLLLPPQGFRPEGTLVTRAYIKESTYS